MRTTKLIKSCTKTFLVESRLKDSHCDGNSFKTFFRMLTFKSDLYFLHGNVFKLFGNKSIDVAYF